ncbi:MAG TPA: DUF488 family protein [Nitrospirota bacterium]|jgi:uncharacterized protein YeaO (DUF488 family)
MSLKTKRVYDEPSPDDGFRVLVDALWPRGLSKEKAKIDLWLKEIAPSETLRNWFSHDRERWEEFRSHYHEELDDKEESVLQLVRAQEKGDVTLLYAARDEEYNNAAALKDFLDKQEKAVRAA